MSVQTDVRHILQLRTFQGYLASYIFRFVYHILNFSILFFDIDRKQHFIIKIRDISIHCPIFGHYLKFLTSDILIFLRSIYLRSGVNNEILFVDEGFKVKEGMVLFDRLECRECYHGLRECCSQFHK
jgi:hypothetical protein